MLVFLTCTKYSSLECLLQCDPPKIEASRIMSHVRNLQLHYNEQSKLLHRPVDFRHYIQQRVVFGTAEQPLPRGHLLAAGRVFLGFV